MVKYIVISLNPYQVLYNRSRKELEIIQIVSKRRILKLFIIPPAIYNYSPTQTNRFRFCSKYFSPALKSQHCLCWLCSTSLAQIFTQSKSSHWFLPSRLKAGQKLGYTLRGEVYRAVKDHVATWRDNSSVDKLLASSTGTKSPITLTSLASRNPCEGPSVL